MLSSALILKDKALVDRTFNSVTSDVPGETLRIDVSTTAQTPRRLRMRKNKRGPRKNVTNDVSSTVYNVQLQHVLRNPTTQELRTAEMNVSIVVPDDVVITDAVLNDLIALQRSFWGDDLRVAAVLRGEA